MNSQGILVSPRTPGVTPVGWIGNGQSSITTVTLGRGHLVVFAGLILNEHLVAPDLTRMILSGGAALAGRPARTDLPPSIVQGGGTARWRVVLTSSAHPVTVVALDPTVQGAVLTRATADPAR